MLWDDNCDVALTIGNENIYSDGDVSKFDIQAMDVDIVNNDITTSHVPKNEEVPENSETSQLDVNCTVRRSSLLENSTTSLPGIIVKNIA